MNSSTNPPKYKKFDFGTVYDDGGRITSAPPPRPKKYFTPEEVEQIRQQAYTQGELSALAASQAAQAQAVQALADAAGQGLDTLHSVLAQHKEECVELALVCAHKIASHALDLFPDAAIKATLEALGDEVSGSPRLIVSAQSPDAALQKAVREAAALTGFTGAIQFRDQPHAAKGAFEIQWPDGRAAYDPSKVYEALRSALKEVLLAEAYHKQKAMGQPLAKGA